MSGLSLKPAPTSPSAHVFRSFTLLSFIAIAVAGIVLAICFRYISIESIMQQSKASNLVVAQTSRHAMHEAIADFLVRREKAPGEAFPAAIATVFADLVKDTAVRKVNIYDRHGSLVFSTRASESEGNQPENRELALALGGEVASKLIYRDRFNRFAGVTDEDNLVQTYLPVLVEHQGKPVGVFEIYTDVSAMVESSANVQVVIALAAILVMVMLYISLLATVRRIRQIIVVQQDALQERSDLLAVLSTRMLNVQESEKQRIAAELHERVAQTISAVKLGVEGAIGNIRNGRDPMPTLAAMVPSLQAATQEVRMVALGLFPPSLHELGLIPTLRWRCREFAERNAHIEVDIELDISEESIPEFLRAIIYRVVDDACGVLSRDAAITRVMLSLSEDEQRILLAIGDDAPEHGLALRDSAQADYLGARERTLLTGGKFAIRPNPWGGLSMHAIWLR